MQYDFQAIEAKWQARWAEEGTFRTRNPGDPGFDPHRPKFYVLDMFPYPSGAGLHVGHPLGYIGTDIVARYKRMTGANVLHPMGFDAFGLPAEQYAVEHGVHPRITTESNISNMRRQLQRFGLSYDWEREIATIEPDYYRWTQWIFLRLFDSWFDHRAGAARPIADLEEELEVGRLLVAGDGSVGDEGTAWADLDPTRQREVIDGHRLAYVAEVPVNWCPGLGTVLANEEVTNEGRSERGNYPVYRRPLKQWMLRITAYSDRLIEDLDVVDWPESIRIMQRNWIGRSEGAHVEFPLVGHDGSIGVYTTRPDTLFGATYMVLAPEHPLVEVVTTPDHAGAVADYRRQAEARSEVDRMAEGKAKTGVFTGGFAVNPVNGDEIPIWVADYVLMTYGTGAIMAVPAHDQRDFEFALQFALPIPVVVDPSDAWLDEQAAAAGMTGAVDVVREQYRKDPTIFREVFTGDGKGFNSHNPGVSLDGLGMDDAKAAITAWLEEQGAGYFQVQYKLRDWLFSRQRYWGEPIPILHGPDGELRAIPDEELPLVLPDLDDFTPHASDDPDQPPRPALGRAPEEWRTVEIDGVAYTRELNTMPQWAGSCWYYLRFIDPENGDALVGEAAESYWMGDNGVDLYVGGVEHAVLHLLYARFWHKVLFDLGYVSSPEPFGRLFNQGYILAAAYQDERGIYVPADDVVERDGEFYHDDEPVTRSFGKMGKSLKNSVTPDDMFHEYGCDTLRLYEMYMGPLDVSKPWNTRDIVGVHRFLQRMWRNFIDRTDGRSLIVDAGADEELLRLLHKTIAAVGHDMDRLRFNTALARLFELNNELVGRETIPREVAESFVLMVAPFAPHVAEELWERLGHATSLAFESWPRHDPGMLVEDTIELVVQVGGKTRARISVAADADDGTVRAAALAEPAVQRHVGDSPVRKVIIVPGRLINIVT
jgi:leucyl-tRNA synthetase